VNTDDLVPGVNGAGGGNGGVNPARHCRKNLHN